MSDVPAVTREKWITQDEQIAALTADLVTMTSSYLDQSERVRKLEAECDSWTLRAQGADDERYNAEADAARLRALLKRARYEGELPDELMGEVDAILTVPA